MKSIVVLIDYFGGCWPEWFPLYLASCRNNPTITWLFHTDCPCRGLEGDNLIFRPMSRDRYVDHVNRVLGIRFTSESNYKLCDLKPMRGVLWEGEISGYDFFGYGDIDVIYGDLRHFYTDEVLEHDIISAHEWCFSGHLTLIRNVGWLRNAFRLVRGWQTLLESEDCERFDEGHFSEVFLRPKRSVLAWLAQRTALTERWYSSRPRHPRLYLKEQYTTPLTPTAWRDGSRTHPTVWYWKDGKITNERDGAVEFIYLHFMNFATARYLDRAYGLQAPWAGRRIMHVASDDVANGICIDRRGFTPL